MKSIQFLALSLFLLALSPILHAQVRMDVTAGANKWGYAGAVGGIYQKWDGSDVTVTTTLNLTQADAKKGNLPRECFVGIVIQDAKQSTRYVAGLFNPGYAKQHKRLPVGLVRHEKRGNWKPISVKEHTLPADQSLQLQVVFRNGKLTLSGCEIGGELKELLTWNAPKGFKPNLIGLAADGFRNGFGPVLFENFQVQGDGPAHSDAFDGKQNQAVWQKVAGKRVLIHMPETFKASLQIDDRKFIFNRGRDVSMNLSVSGAKYIGQTLLLHVRVFNDQQQVVHDAVSQIENAFAEGRWSITIPKADISRCGVYRLDVTVGQQDQPIHKLYGQFAIIEPHPATGSQDPDSPYVFCWGQNQLPVLERLGMHWLRNSWYLHELIPQDAKGQYNFDKRIDRWFKHSSQYGLSPMGPICNIRITDHTSKAIEDYVKANVNIIKQAKARYGDQFRLIEIGNEPENWPMAPLADQWLTMARAQTLITERVHQDVPGVQVMSTGTTHVNMGFLSQLAVIGGPNAADLIGVHGYRCPSPPEFGHVQDITAIQSLFPGKPIWCNEQAYFAQPADYQPTYDNPDIKPLELDELTQGIYLPRLFMSQFAAGYAGVSWFAWDSNHGLTDSPTHVRPAAVTLATLTRLLPHPQFKRRLTPRNSELWALQFQSDDQLITSIWSLGPHYVVTVNPLEIDKAYDVYGNELTLQEDAGLADLAIGQAPVYLRGPVGNLLAIRKTTSQDPSPYPLLKNEKPSAQPLKIRILPKVTSLNQSQLLVRLTNTTSQTHSGTLAIKFNEKMANFYRAPLPSAWRIIPADNGRFTVDGNQSIDVLCSIVSDDPSMPFDPYASNQGFVAAWWLSGYFFAARATLDDQQVVDHIMTRGTSLRAIPYCPNVKIDGQLADWQDVPVFPQLGNLVRNSGLNKFWQGRADYSPQFQLAWNDHGLLLAAQVTDDIQYQPYHAKDLWRCDSLQLAINADVEHPSPVSFHVMTMGLPANQKPEVYRQRSTMDRPAGLVADAQIRVTRTEGDYERDGLTTYEVMIPWSQITPFRPNQNRLNFSIQFNDADGWERKGWEGWFIPMGGHLIDPNCMGDLTLVK